MKFFLRLSIPVLFLMSHVFTYGQTVTKAYVAPSSTSVDGVGSYGSPMPSVTFNPSDFTQGCQVTDVDVVIAWAKTAGTCTSPTGGNSQHQETSFRIQHPTAGPQILALPGTWTGQTSTSSVITRFSTGNPIPTGIPVSGTFGPNNGNLAAYNGQSPYGAWNLDIGDQTTGAPVCLVWYQVEVTTTPDVTPPTISVPANITVNAAAGQCGATVTFVAPTATDNCSATISQTAGLASGAFFPVGVTNQTYTASDASGNSVSGSFTVTVVDNQNPTVICPPTIFAGCNPVVNYPDPTVSDNCGVVGGSILSGFASGSTFPLGTTPVTIEVVDAAGLTATCSFNVIVDTESTDPTSITASGTTVCSGAPVTLTVNGGSLGTNAQWFWYIGGCGGQLVGSGASIVVNPLSTTNYFVRAQGPCNNSACVEVLINVTPAPSVGFSGITSPSACGAADGIITAIAGGGTAPYVFTWSNGSVGATINGLAAGPYEVTVTDATGCTDFSSVSLNDPGASPVTLVSSDGDNTICAGESVTFTASGAFQYQYYINGVPVSTQNPFTTTALLDGQNVYVTGTDFNFCTYTSAGINFIVRDNPVIDETVSDPSGCALSDGLIQTLVSGGLPPYSYLWSNGQVTSNISGLPAAPYFLTVTDDNGCFSSETYALSDPGAQPVTMASSEDPNNEICAGESITFTASGSNTYQFYVDGQPTSTTNPFVTAALTDGQSVAATGTDGNNCTATSNIIYPIVNPGPTVLLVSNDADTTICVGQSISFFASGGLTYEFLVDGVSQGPASSTSVFVTSTLTNGQVVSVIATDGNLCDVESDGMPVTVNPSPTVAITSFSDPTSCGASDGVITADATGGTPGYTYGWSHGPQGPTVANLNAGSYFVTATDDAGCTAVISQSLSDVGSSPVTLTSDATNSTICGGETVTFTGSGATTYVFYVNGFQVSTQNPYITDTLVDGDIIAVMGLDTQLCAATSAPSTFVVHPEIQVGVTSFVNPSSCGASDGFANALTIGGVPAYDYLWTPSGQITPVAVGLSAGQYAVTVTDVNGCQSTDAVSLSDPGTLVVSLVASPSGLTICEGTPVEFTASGAGTYQFFVDGVAVGSTNPYTNAAILNGQTVAVVGTDANNCSVTSPGLHYNVLPTPVVTLTLPSHACSNEDFVEFVGGSPVGGDYTVAYGNFSIIGDLFFPDLAGPGATNVDYTYEAPNGCDATASAVYNVLQAPQVDLGNDTTVCLITLDAGSGYASYAWTPTGDITQTTSASQSGGYEVTVVDANGCIGTDVIVVTVNPIPSPIITPSGVVEFCIGNTVILSAEPGYDGYSWTTGDNTQTTEWGQSDTIVLTVTNQYGCQGTSEVVLVMNEPMTASPITADGPLEFCVGGSVNLSVAPGYASYLWNSGSTTQSVTVIESGDYWPILMDGNGCIDSMLQVAPVTVTVWDPEPIVSEDAGLLTVTNSGDFTGFQWFHNGNPIPGATSAAYTINPTGSGNYYVCVTDANGCSGCSPNFELTCCVGIEEANFDGNVSVYPNPNSGQFTLEVELARQMDVTVGLYDMIGKQVWLDSRVGNTDSLRKQYDITEIPNGVYFLRIYADNQMTVQKIIKQ
ncbi:MAG: HYR domain-containing protein [Flavobacteriales bacterium]|nr:HYR domain-containing protein [Flavobacteriales bacterium]